MTPPTWRSLAARARKLGLRLQHGRHEASLLRSGVMLHHLSTWVGNGADNFILRLSVAAALEQLEAGR